MTLITYGTFPGGKMSEFKDTSQNAFQPWATVSQSDLKPGMFKAHFKAGPGIPTMAWDKDKCYRVHALGNNLIAGTFLKAGTTFFRGLSLRWTIPPTTTWAGDEIHASGGTPLGDGPAPLNGAWCEGGSWNWIVRGGGNPGSRGSYKQHDFGPRGQRWKGLSEKINVNEWLHTVCGYHFAPDSSGWFEMWACHDGGQMVNVVPRISIPTCFPSPIGHYPMMSCYHSADGAWHEMEYTAGAYASTIEEIKGHQAAQLTHSPWSGVTPLPPVDPPPVDPPPPSSGVTAKCSIQKGASVPNDAAVPVHTDTTGPVAEVYYFVDGTFRAKSALAPKFPATVNMSAVVPGPHTFGFACHDAAGLEIPDATFKAYPITVSGTVTPPPPVVTDAQHARNAEAALKKTTDSYPTWLEKKDTGKYPDVTKTNWWKALDELGRIK